MNAHNFSGGVHQCGDLSGRVARVHRATTDRWNRPDVFVDRNFDGRSATLRDDHAQPAGHRAERPYIEPARSMNLVTAVDRIESTHGHAALPRPECGRSVLSTGGIASMSPSFRMRHRTRQRVTLAVFLGAIASTAMAQTIEGTATAPAR
jgi:hypothetical protein